MENGTTTATFLASGVARNTANSEEAGNATVEDGLIAVKLVFMSAISLVGVVGNALICATLVGRRRKSSEMFILNLVITDLLVCAVGIPLDMYAEFHSTFPSDPVLCKIIWPGQTLLVLISIMTLTAMAMERYRVIITPLKPRLKKMDIVKCIVLIWLLGFTAVTPYVWVLGYKGGICDEFWPSSRDSSYYTLVLFVVDYCIPLTVITYCYGRIGVRLYRSGLKFNASPRRGGRFADAQRCRLRRNARIIKVFAFAVLMFVVCMLPGDAYWLYKEWGESEFVNNEHFNAFANILLYSNSMMNPFIFGSCELRCPFFTCLAATKTKDNSYTLRFSFTSSLRRSRGGSGGRNTAAVNRWYRVAKHVRNNQFRAPVMYETNV